MANQDIGPDQPDHGRVRRKVTVIVSSDRATRGDYEDRSGPAAIDWLGARGYEVLDRIVVLDEREHIEGALTKALDLGSDLALISGGTGLGPRDVTPQTLDAFCTYSIPGIGELLRRESLKYSLNAYLSRCGGWVKGSCLVLALPGNPKAVTEQLDILEDLLPHAIASVRGECAHRRKTAGHQ